MTPDQLLALAQAALDDEQRGTPGPWVALPDQYAPGDAFLADANNIPLGYDADNVEIAASSRTREPQLARAVVALMEVLEKLEVVGDWNCIHDPVRSGCEDCDLHVAVDKARAALAGVSDPPAKTAAR